jgi:hypothetical protein
VAKRESTLDRAGRFLERLVLAPLMAIAAYLVEQALRRLLAPRPGEAARGYDRSGADQDSG